MGINLPTKEKEKLQVSIKLKPEIQTQQQSNRTYKWNSIILTRHNKRKTICRPKLTAPANKKAI